MIQSEKFKFSFRLQDEFAKDENSMSKINIQLSSSSYSVSIHQLFKYSQYFQEQFFYRAIIKEINNKFQEVDEKYHFNDKSIQLFFNLLEDEEETEITIDEYFDLLKLSDLLGIKSLQKCLMKYAEEHSKDIDFIINMFLKQQETIESDSISINDNISIDIENIMGDKIEECLLNQNFGRLPISTIYRIIEKGQNEIKSSDLLYDFIIKSLEERFSLFYFLQFENLSDEKFDELYRNYQQSIKTNQKKFFQFLPNNITYIKNLRDCKKSLENRINEIEKEKNQQVLKINELTAQINELTIDNKNTNKNTIEKNQVAQCNIRKKPSISKYKPKTFFENKKQDAKSKLVLGINPADTEVDLDLLEKKIREIEIDGLHWGKSQRQEKCFGLFQIQITAFVTDDVSIDDLQEIIELWEDDVASTEIIEYQKI